jgi:hypothetical protein
MAVYLVTGTSGAGKSTVARRLAAIGHQAVSTDATAGLCGWTDAAGRPAERPDQPDATWLTAHNWSWSASRLDGLIESADPDRPLWLCGNAANQPDFLDRFDLVFLLELDEATMLRRLDDPARGNDFGRIGDSRALLIAERNRVHAAWRARGAIPIDATQPLNDVIAALLSAVPHSGAST